MKTTLFATLLCSLLLVLAGPTAVARTIEFETIEVTRADVALSPDGQWLIFTILGHLFRLPVEGGTAEQLTFGPYYDSDPVFSPDGRQVAFISDRDGSEGNVFVVDPSTRAITQVTREPWAGRPAWTPDGNAIVYLSFAYETRQSVRFPPTSIRRIDLKSGVIETISVTSQRVRSVFHFPDGRLAWTVLEGVGLRGLNRGAITRFESVSRNGSVSTLATFAGIADRAVAGPTADEIYVRRYLPLQGPFYLPAPEALLLIGLADRTERPVFPLANVRGGRPAFRVSRDGIHLYVGHGGRIWKLDVSTGTRHRVPFRARVAMEVLPVLGMPRGIVSSETAAARVVLHPRLSPDDGRLVFAAGGYLWEQLDDNQPAHRITEGIAFEQDPTISPDGRRLAFIRSPTAHVGPGTEQEIVLREFGAGRTVVLASGARYHNLAWSPDGERLFFDERISAISRRLVALHVRDGRKEVLYQPFSSGTWWSPRYDDESAYFTDPADRRTLLRLPLRSGSRPESFLRTPVDTWAGVPSPDKQRIILWRGTGIWQMPAGPQVGATAVAGELTADGGATFAFTPDGTALVYATGRTIWHHPLPDGPAEPIPVRVSLPRPVAPAVLLRGVRVLDFDSGGFTNPTSLLLEEGRIRWVGPERGRVIPRGVVVLDGGGRFVIPGLFEMHAHLRTRYDARAFLAYGITTVRDVGSDLLWIAALSDRSEATAEPIPRIVYAGEFLDDWLVKDEEQARALVLRQKGAGASFIKIHPPIPWGMQRAGAKYAREAGLPIAAHGTTVEEVVKGVMMGFTSLEHTINHTRSYDDVLQLLAAAGTYWTPTLGAGGFNDLLVRDEPERLDDSMFRAFAPEPCIERGRAGSFMRAVETRTLRGAWVDQLAGVRSAHRAGVRLLVGTDAFCHMSQSVGAEGSSLHWELEHFVSAGLTPLEVLQIATSGAAAALGSEQELGTIEPGKLADIVLLDENPLDDIRNTQSIWRTIKGGWVFDPEKLRPPQSAEAEQ